jgi:SAM-dependent methyltransferase
MAGVLDSFFNRTDLRDEPDVLRWQVCKAYTAAADDPETKHPFPVGRAFAESVGYPAHLLDVLPATAAESFAGVSNLAVIADIPPGSAVLDVGCGGGLDSLVAARKTGAAGSVQGVDFSKAMVDNARKSALEADQRVTFHVCDAEDLPIEPGSVDVVLANGIFNLNPMRRQIFREIHRVLKAGGTVFAAELVFKRPQKKKPVRNLDDWFS